MSLSEGKMFTIEALNRIDGFVWPEGAEFATFDRGYTDVNFWTGEPTANNPKFFGPLASSVYAAAYHPDWRNSLITREQFDSVDGWVRHDNTECPANSELQVQVKMHGLQAGKPNRTRIAKGWVWVNGGITHWRYHKPTKETEMQNPKPYKKQDCIETLIDKRKDAIEQKRLALAALEEAEAKERELMLSIQAWAESYGFDIRVLDESDEVLDVEPNPEPELVITDWRDLQVGDVVEVREMAVVDGFIGCVGLVKRININAEHGPLLVKFDNGEEWWVKKWKFICRPEKK